MEIGLEKQTSVGAQVIVRRAKSLNDSSARKCDYFRPFELYPSNLDYKLNTGYVVTSTTATQQAWDSLSYTTQSSSTSTSFVKSIFIFSPATNSWVISRATLDTGSTYNWISKHFLEKRLGRSIHTLPQEHSRPCVAFSGHVVVPLGFVKLVWYEAEGARCATHETQFLVCEQNEGLFDMIIGSRTIVRENLLSLEIATIWQSQRTQGVLPPVIGGEANRLEAERQRKRLADNKHLHERTVLMQDLVYNKKVLKSTPHQSRAGSMRQPARASIPQKRFEELEQLRDEEPRPAATPLLRPESAVISPREAARNHWGRQSTQARNSNAKPESHLAPQIRNQEPQTAQGKREVELEIVAGPSNWESPSSGPRPRIKNKASSGKSPPLNKEIQVEGSNSQAMVGGQANGNTPGGLTVVQTQTRSRSQTSEESSNAILSTPATSMDTPPENGKKSGGIVKEGGDEGEKKPNMIKRFRVWRRKRKESKKGKGKEIVEERSGN